ncbi:DUF2237 family protein [Roseivirga sp. BDSF3-8]|uniref:DUF2237 family protein n=1 Tax=Roseivirga sp. BDSF3-8 TaxID=3241598 RepID=UPI003531DFBE
MSENGYARNILGQRLELCCTAPMTGFYRNGYCLTGPRDRGTHVVCAIMTEAFLSYTRSRGNDLSTPMPAYDFPGLKPGDKWCLCVSRWKEAHQAGAAPPIIAESTHINALEVVDKETLLQYLA